MPKRNYIDEIKDIKNRRLKKSSRWDQRNRRFHSLIEVMVESDKISNLDVKREMLRYIFIGLVACLEGYYRLVIKDIIDLNKECRENVTKLKNIINFDIDTVLAIHGKTISLGDFVSHLIKLNNFEDLNKTLSIILGDDYIEHITNMEMKSDDGDEKAVPNDIVKDIKLLFKMRNIYCHELAPKKESLKTLNETAFLSLIAFHELTFANEVYINEFIKK